MKKNTIHLLLAVIVLGVISGMTVNILVAAENTKIEDAGFIYQWFENWDEGIEAAKNENKPVLIDFMSDHCGSCVAMEKQTFATTEIKERLISDWICIKINTHHAAEKGTFDGKTMNYYKLSKYFRVSGVPTFVFLDKEQKPVQSVVGYKDKEIFGPILDYMKDEAYTKGISFKEYREKSGTMTEWQRKIESKRIRE